MSASLFITSILGKLSRIGGEFSKLGIEMFDTTTFKFAVNGDAMTIEELSDLTDGLFLTQPTLNLLTLGEGNVLAFSGNGVTMRLGVLVHSVLVVLDGMTLACFELLGTPFLCQEPVAFNLAIHILLHLFLQFTPLLCGFCRDNLSELSE